MFRACVVGLIENPALIAANIPQAEICETVTAVLRYGMLKNNDPVEAAGRLVTERSRICESIVPPGGGVLDCAVCRKFGLPTTADTPLPSPYGSSP